MSDNSGITYQIIEKSLSIPGVKVNRRDFLIEIFADKIAQEEIHLLLTLGPVKSELFTPEQLKKAAIKNCNKNKWQCSATSFASGIPGGFAMFGTIPLDTMQFFGFNLRVAQQIAYIYGHEDFWSGDVLDNERVESELVVFLGTMLGAGGAAQVTRLLSAQLAKKVATDLPKKALTKTIYYPIIKNIAKSIGINLTKNTFAKGLSKIIPVLGGALSGGITYKSMSVMNKRLYEAFDASVDYTKEEIIQDLKDLKKSMPDIFQRENGITDVEFISINENYKPN